MPRPAASLILSCTLECDAPAQPRKAKLDHDPIRFLALKDIHPSPENDELYQPINPDDPEIQSLAQSIRDHGLQEPLLLSGDSFVISGHRRLTAARVAGLNQLPCRIRQDVSHEHDPDLFLKLLRECNRQRLKSLDEKVREEVISASPQEAYQSLLEHRRKASQVNIQTLDIGEKKERAVITAAKAPLLAAVKKVIGEMQEYLPLSDRQIHYQLLNDPPLIHASKRKSTYRNDAKSYKALVDLLTRARVAGLISFNAIADETRPVSVWGVHQDVQGFVRNELDSLLQNYWRDLLQSQPNHLELIIEKNTVLSVLRPVAAEYCLPLTSGRGYCSLPPRHAIAQRYRKSGKSKLLLLIVSDFDPDGQTIAASFARSMRDDFAIGNVEAVKVALTAEQVEQFKLPPGLKAKAGCSTRQAFVEAHGEHVYELEALSPADLQRLTRQAIDSVLDQSHFNAELDQEKQEAAELATIRRRVLAAVGEGTR